MDMHSGGRLKEAPYQYILIEAPEDVAKIIFYNRFHHNPKRVSCTCCGEDYSISESKTLKQATAYDRNCLVLKTPRNKKTKLYKQPNDPWFQEHYYLEPGEEIEAEKRGYKIDKRFSWGKYQTVEQYLTNKDVLVIYEKDIKKEETIGEVPEQGYVWVD